MTLSSLLRLILAAAALLVGLSLVTWKMSNAIVSPQPELDFSTLTATPGPPWFVNVADTAGISFQHYSCDPARQYIQVERRTPATRRRAGGHEPCASSQAFAVEGLDKVYLRSRRLGGQVAARHLRAVCLSAR